MEKQQKEIVWTKRAVRDLQKVYNFNTELQGEEMAFSLVQCIIERAELLMDDRFTNIGAIDETFAHLNRDYKKLIDGYFKITYRESSNKKKIYINRIFDTRQNPKRNR